MDSANLNQLNASRHKRQRRRRRQGNGKVSDAGLSNGGSGRTTLSERLVQVKPLDNAKVQQNVERLAEKPSKTEEEVQSKPLQKPSNSPPPPPPPSPSKPRSSSSFPSSPEQNAASKKSKKQRKKKTKENARSSSECIENFVDDAGEQKCKPSINKKQSRLSQSSDSSQTASLAPEPKQSTTTHPTVFDNVGVDAGERKSKTSINQMQSRASIKSISSQTASAKLGEQKSKTSISNKQSEASLKSKSSQTGSSTPLEAKQSITMHQTVSENVGDDAGERKSKTSLAKKQSRVSQVSNSSHTADNVGAQKSKTSITKKQSRLSQLSNSSHGVSLAPEVSDASIPLSRLTQSETLLLYTNNFDIKSLIDKELIEATESVLIPLPSDLNEEDYDYVKEDCSTSPVLQGEEATKGESREELVPLQGDTDLAASCTQTNDTDSTDAQHAEHNTGDGHPEISTHDPRDVHQKEELTDLHQKEELTDLHQKEESTDVDLTEDSTDVHETENSTDLSKMFYESRLQALLEDTREIANELLQKGAQASPQLALSEIPHQQHETIRSLKEIIKLLESVELKQCHEHEQEEKASIASVPIEHEENHDDGDDVANEEQGDDNEEQDDANEEQELDVENLEDSYACVSNGMIYRVLQRKESPTCYSPLRNGKRLSRLEEFLLVKNNEMNTDRKETSSRSADSNQSSSSSSSTTTSRAPSAAASACGLSLTAINDDEEQVEVHNDCKTSRTLLKTKKVASSWLRRFLRDCIGIFVTLMFLLFALFYCRDAKLQISSL